MKKYLIPTVYSIIALCSCARSTHVAENQSIETAESIVIPDLIKFNDSPFTKSDLINHLTKSKSISITNYKSGSPLPIFQYDDNAINHLVQLINTSEKNRYEIIGHTHSMGGKEANYKFSLERAIIIKRMLITNYGLEAKKIKHFGEGEEYPIETNHTAEGRAMNSRVEIIVDDQL